MASETLIPHLIDFKQTLKRMVFGYVSVATLCILYMSTLFQYTLSILKRQLPLSFEFINTSVAGNFTTPLSLALFYALFISLPWLLWQLWSFCARGLYAYERRYIKQYALVSIVLFYSGMLTAFFLISPKVLAFFYRLTPEHVTMMTNIQDVLDFLLPLMLCFGLAFQTPIITQVLIRFRWVSVQTLQKKRPVVILLAFIIGMLMTPPDVLSQVALAVPICLLFELGLLWGTYTLNRANSALRPSSDDLSM